MVGSLTAGWDDDDSVDEDNGSSDAATGGVLSHGGSFDGDAGFAGAAVPGGMSSSSRRGTATQGPDGAAGRANGSGDMGRGRAAAGGGGSGGTVSFKELDGDSLGEDGGSSGLMASEDSGF